MQLEDEKTEHVTTTLHREGFLLPGDFMKTLQLDADAWDITLDAAGNIAVASDKESILQDVCSAARTWLGEALYDTGQGVPYDTDILQSNIDISFYASEVEDAALAVPGVAAATCHLANPTKERQLQGAIVITFTDGSTDYVQF